MKKDSGTHKVRRGVLGTIMNLILWIFSLSCIFPIVWMIYSSLKEKRAFNADIIGLPKSPTLINYTRILSNSDYHLGASMWNSVRTTVLSIVLIVAFSFIVGYILSRIHFKLNRLIYVMFLMGMLIPIHSLLVPIYVVFKKCGLSNQWFTLLFPYVSFGLPMGIFLVEGYVKTVPVSLEEAAAIDGATPWETLWKVKLPMVMPSITICVFLTLTNSFKLFDQNLALTGGDPNHMTEMMALNIYQTFYARAGAQWKGLGQSKAVLFCLLVIVISMIQLKATRSKEVQQ